jgi:PAS domain S-box-containing protein
MSMTKKPTYEELEQRVRTLEEATCGHEKTKDELVKLSHAVEQCPIAIMMTDASGIIDYVNPRFTEFTGYKPEEVIGKHARDLGRQSHEEETRMWDVISAGKVWQGEFYNRKKNGEYYWERASISSVKDENDTIIHFVKVSEDITELKKAQEALREVEEKRYQDKKRMAVLEFANEIALKLMDEIRNPLSAIGGFANRLVCEDCSREKLSEYGKIVFEQSKRLDEALKRALLHLKGASEKA